MDISLKTGFVVVGIADKEDGTDDGMEGVL